MENNDKKEKKPIYKNWIFWLTLVIFLFIVGSFNAPTEQPNESNTAQAEPSADVAEKQWVEIAKFDGTTSEQTDPFTVEADRWRIVWNHKGELNFSVVAKDIEKDFTSCNLMVNQVGIGSDTTNCYEKGEFFLDIGAAGPWDITVEQYK